MSSNPPPVPFFCYLSPHLCFPLRGIPPPPPLVLPFFHSLASTQGFDQNPALSNRPFSSAPLALDSVDLSITYVFIPFSVTFFSLEHERHCEEGESDDGEIPGTSIDWLCSSNFLGAPARLLWSVALFNPIFTFQDERLLFTALPGPCRPSVCASFVFFPSPPY